MSNKLDSFVQLIRLVCPIDWTNESNFINSSIRERTAKYLDDKCSTYSLLHVEHTGKRKSISVVKESLSIVKQGLAGEAKLQANTKIVGRCGVAARRKQRRIDLNVVINACRDKAAQRVIANEGSLESSVSTRCS